MKYIVHCRIAAVLMIALAGASGAGAQLLPTPAQRMAQIRRTSQCRPFRFSIDVLDRTDFRGDACSLVALAIHQVALGRTKAYGFVPADTARIVGAIALDNGAGTWVVGLQMKERDESITMTVDQETGKLAFHKDHPFKVHPVKRPR